MMILKNPCRFGTSCCLAVVACAISAGCFGTRGPDRPPFDPEGSAGEAISLYDENSDGVIDKTEVAKCPGLKAGFASTDANQDEQLSREEIANRILYFKSAPTIVVQGSTRITYKKRPLGGATVTFEPESFLGSAFVPCTGVTESNGVASIKGHAAEFPGIYLGFYRVRISKMDNDKERIPAKYNAETELGYEATDDMNMMLADIISFDLK